MKRPRAVTILLGLRPLLVAAMIAATGWLGQWKGSIFALATFLLIIFFASQVLFEAYDLPDSWIAFQLMLGYLLGRNYPYLVVNDGAIDEQSPMAKIGRRGPGVIIIDEASAVLMEGPGSHLSALGPGTHFIPRFRRVRAAADLRLQQRIIELDNVFSRDGIPLFIRFIVLFRILQDDAALINSGKHQMRQDALVRALLSTRDWRMQTELVAKSRLRDTIAEYRLDDIHAEFPKLQDALSQQQEGFQTPRIPLQEELKNRLNTETVAWGVEIVKVALDEIRMPGDVTKQMIEAWGAHWEAVVKTLNADTEAQAARTRAEGESDAALVSARGKKEAAAIESEATLTQAEANAEATIIEGRAHAEARAEYIRRVLGAYQIGGRPLDEALLADVLKSLAANEDSRILDRLERVSRQGATGSPANSSEEET